MNALFRALFVLSLIAGAATGSYAQDDLTTAMQFVATGCSKKALVIGADANSRAIDPTDVKTYPLFGDGAGAVLLQTAEGERGVLSTHLYSDGRQYKLLYVDGGPSSTQTAGSSRKPASARRLRRGRARGRRAPASGAC